jgi:hypothetical protein
MLSLRPPRDKPFSSLRLLTVCSLFGISHGMCANAAFALTHEYGGHELPPVYAVPLLFALIGFVCGQLAFLGAWNRRAERLSRQLAWVDVSQRTPRS